MNSKLKNVEDVYPLSPMQEAMLLHTLSGSENDVLFNQFCYEVRGALDFARFRAAWEEIIQCHAVLRTAFVWGSNRDPLQVVRRQVDLPIQEFDWCQLSRRERQVRLEQFKADDRAKGFNPKKAPLMRLAIARIEPELCYLIWSSHHLIIDRWCLATIISKFFSLYEPNPERSRTGHAIQFQHYIEWIQQRDEFAAETFWRESLFGYSGRHALTRRRDSADKNADDRILPAALELSAAATAALRSYARSEGLTVSSVVQGALALTLNSFSGRQDVIFGATVSGRPAGIPDVEHIVGSFINNVPVRVTMSADDQPVDWLKGLQLAQQRRAEFEYVSLAKIHQWAGARANEPLFDTLLVWLSTEPHLKPQSLQLTGLAGEMQTAYPLTISVEETHDTLVLRAMPNSAYRLLYPPADFLQLFGERIEVLIRPAAGASLAALPGFKGGETFEEQNPPRDCIQSSARHAPSTAVVAKDLAGGREASDMDILHELLLGEWCGVLELDEVGPDDDFFELGGNSLIAARLHARIESALRCRIAMISLFQAATIRQMAKLLAGGEWRQSASLVMPVQTEGSLPALFCIASPEVNTLGYALLARYLDPDREVHVVQAPPDSQHIRRLSPAVLPELAAQYLDAVREIQPSGPYYLLGMCTGSQLALEMARHLDDDGQSVAFVGVINTWALYTLAPVYRVVQAMHRYGSYLRRLREIAGMERMERQKALQHVVGQRLARFRRVPAFAGGAVSRAPTGNGENHDKTRDPWIEGYGWAKDDPGAPKYDGTVTVFRLDPQQRWRTGEPDLGWGRHARHTEIVRLPGTDHLAILREPYVRHVGEQVRHYQRIKTDHKRSQLDESYSAEGIAFDEHAEQT